ncbi:unnamed protein product [Paramecium sonneborni]|uniref:Transmembrane protein n=1 Tax=Paramecium sonneborni TaxID=65129 RepID=A0A8S1PFN9_9CILI|nr:unnamed protein product [Paramecium sonneborni]
MIVLIVCLYLTHQTVIYNFDANANDIDGWQDFYGCDFKQYGDIKYFGPKTYFFDYISRIFLDLESHSHIQIYAQVLSINNNQEPKLFLDERQIEPESVESSQTFICGNLHYTYTISQIYQHNRRNAWIQIQLKRGGLIKLKLTITKCLYGCISCIENNPKICLYWQVHQNLLNNTCITNSEGWTGVFTYQNYLGCGDCQFLKFQIINYQTQLPPHQDILIRFFKIGYQKMVINYMFGNKIISLGNQLIEILINNHNDCLLKLEIKTQTPQQFIQLRDFEIYYTYEDILLENFNEGCLKQINNICLICQDGWTLDIQQQICKRICGDKVVQGQEFCDDGNQLSNDGCYNCIYESNRNCLKFEYGKCIKCQNGYMLQRFKCIPICGDGLIVETELCDDNNNFQFDGCFRCQNSCQLECLYCQKGVCFQCIQGWSLIDYQCYQICGDNKVAIYSIEQCDDLSDITCLDCIIKCLDYCLICSKYNICEICEEALYVTDDKCVPICGDSLVSKYFEDCDDGNDQPYDGCFKCQYQCQHGCKTCEKGYTCLECDEGFSLNNYTLQCDKIEELIEPQIIEIYCLQNQQFINGICIDLCGDGKLNSNYEECDDGNNNPMDGCSFFCGLEEDFHCQNTENSYSICILLDSPDFKLINQSDKKSQTQIIQLSFTQSVQLQKSLSIENIFNYIISPQTQYKMEIRILQNLNQNLNNSTFQFIIYFQQSIKNPQLRIEIDRSIIFNEYNLELKKLKKEINLGNPFILSGQTQQQLKQIVQMNEALIYSMISISALVVLTGNTVLFFNLLELLQSLSYIRYMKYTFPPHLKQFLNTFTKISLKPIFDYFEVDQQLSKLNGGIFPFQTKQSTLSKEQDPLNCFFLINAKSCYFSILTSIATYIICCIISSQLIHYFLGRKFSQYFHNFNSLKRLRIFQKYFFLTCLKLKLLFFREIIFQAYYSIIHQLTFSALLQFPNYQFNTFFNIINSANAILALILIITISFKLIAITSSSIKNKNKWRYFYQGIQGRFWGTNFKSFQILRIQFYITIIVEFMNYPEVQSILLSMLSFYFLIFIIKFKPLKSKYEFFKQIFKELFLMLITGSFLVYSMVLDDDQFLLFGWIHIYSFVALLSITLIIDLIEHVIKIVQNYKQKQLLKQIKLEKSYINNKLQLFVREI